jgi:hypothetical protein
MNRVIYNLVRNSLPESVSPTFVRELIKGMSKADIVELARQELKVIEYFVRIELPEWNYWKEKKNKLEFLIRYYSI